MSRCKVRTLKGLLNEAIFLLDFISKENRHLKMENKNLHRRVNELIESCENFAEVEGNLLKKIEKLSRKPTGIKQRVLRLLG
ncbi:hypothetical protein ACJDU8_12800 [Clostridium sp. WILCCON 0269]|uniref:Uncharacterized protein n=1 Tax=Candidatus Clostridium eludens TaxID=3381663 RepID=A0ABW8SL46_9CLOT